MQLILYTDTDRIRSILGVSDQDIKDDQITARGLSKELRLDLLSWAPAHEALYYAGSLGSATDMEQSLADSLTLYSTYFCTVLVVKSLQLSAPQSISDGKNSMNRFATMDWQGLTLHLKERLAFYKVFIQDAASATPVVPVYNPFAGIALATDPVISSS